MHLNALCKGAPFLEPITKTIAAKVMPAACTKEAFKKTLLIMKFTAILLLAFCLQAGAKGYSQITIKEQNVPLQKVFAIIKQQTGYDFLYPETVIEHAGKISITITNVSLETALETVLKDKGLAYSIVDKTIIIRKKEEHQTNEQLVEQKATIDISGRVIDNEGNPLQGASVKVKGSAIGTTTDANGAFVIKGVDEDAILVFSFTEHDAVEVKVSNRTSIIAVLKKTETNLQEVVVNKGYYTEKQKYSVGSVGRVTAKEIEKQPVSNPLLALQGRIPGVEIMQNSGLPGAGVTVRIRGLNSIQNGNDPLYVIDGVPYISQLSPGIAASAVLGNSGSSINGNPLNFINPAVIESIDILKDADATSIYGSRGANGVILITTKKGKVGKSKFALNIQTGWAKKNNNIVKLLNTKQYIEMRKEAYSNDGLVPSANPNDPGYAPDLTIWDLSRNTNWQKSLLNGTAHFNDLQATLSGGHTNTQYLIGAGFHHETTIFPGDFSDRKVSVHFNIANSSANKKFKVQLSGTYLVDNNNIFGVDLTNLASQLPPNAPLLYNSDGTLNWEPNPSTGFATWTNPLAYLNMPFKTNTKNLVGSSTIGYEIITGLNLKTNLGYTNMQMNEFSGLPASYSDPALLPLYGNSLRSANYGNNNNSSWIVEPQLSYEKVIKKGRLSFLFGGTIQESKSRGEVLQGEGYSSDLILEDPKSAASIKVSSTTGSVYKYNALFGRFGLTFHDQYLINITARRDGSNRFGPENQFHNFGEVGLGWIFSNSSQLRDNNSFLSFGKIRASYGTTGNDQIGDYSFLDVYSSLSGIGVPFQGLTGLQITRHFNPNLAWEETKKGEIGLELGLFKNKIEFTTSYYHHRSSNQLVSFSLPSVTGFNTINTNLPALVQNSGWEFLINSNNISTKKVTWTTALNLTIQRNKLVKVSSGMATKFDKQVGHPLSSVVLYNFLGVDPSTGKYIFSDAKGNPTFTPDIVADGIVKSIMPIYFGGLQNTIKFHGFEIDFLFQFIKQIGPNNRFGNFPGDFYSGNQPVAVLNRWRKPGDAASVQRFNTNYAIYQQYGNAINSDAAYSDASYARLKNLSISWQLPAALKRKSLESFQIYLHGQNLFTISRFKKGDAEMRFSNSLPPLRLLTIGFKASL